MRMVFVLPLLLAAVFGGLLYIRLSPMDAERWHVDPSSAARPSTPNAYLLRDDDGDAPAIVLPAAPADTARALEAVLETEPRVTRLAGSAAEGHVTYVQRSRLMGFPDAVSIRLVPDGQGTRVIVFSRSRFGYSDAGVNAARVTRWLDLLRGALGA